MASSTEKRSSNNRRAVSEGVQEMGSAVRGLAAESIGAVRDRADEYVERGREYIDRGRERAHELRESVESRVHAQPGKSLLIAAGIGFLIGLLFKRR